MNVKSFVSHEYLPLLSNKNIQDGSDIILLGKIPTRIHFGITLVGKGSAHLKLGLWFVQPTLLLFGSPSWVAPRLPNINRIMHWMRRRNDTGSSPSIPPHFSTDYILCSTSITLQERRTCYPAKPGIGISHDRCCSRESPHSSFKLNLKDSESATGSPTRSRRCLRCLFNCAASGIIIRELFAFSILREGVPLGAQTA
jgi:hypothetical protein